MYDPVKNSERFTLATGATGWQGGAEYRHRQKKGFKSRALVPDPNSNPARRLMEHDGEMYQGAAMIPTA